MGRPEKFSIDDVLDAALGLVTAAGPRAVTIDLVAEAVGGNVGSIYHRFPSKNALLATLWLRCARSGHQGFIEATRIDDLDEALMACITHYPRWASTSLAEARVLAALGREELVGSWPDQLDGELAAVNDELAAALDGLAVRLFGTPSPSQRNALTTALLDIPAGAIRRYLLAGRPPPAKLGPLLTAASLAYLDRLPSRDQPK